MSAERLLALAQILHATRQQEAATQDDIGEVGTRGQGAFVLVARGRFEHFQTVYPDQRTVHLVDMHTGQIVIRNQRRCRRSPAATRRRTSMPPSTCTPPAIPSSNPLGGADRVTREAYSHEVSSCGFWPGSGPIQEAAFYACAVPQPEGFAGTATRPASAWYSAELGEFLLHLVTESRTY